MLNDMLKVSWVITICLNDVVWEVVEEGCNLKLEALEAELWQARANERVGDGKSRLNKGRQR